MKCDCPRMKFRSSGFSIRTVLMSTRTPEHREGSRGGDQASESPVPSCRGVRSPETDRAWVPPLNPYPDHDTPAEPGPRTPERPCPGGTGDPLDESLVEHRVGDLDEAGDVRAVRRSCPGVPYSSAVSLHLRVDRLHDVLQPGVDLLALPRKAAGGPASSPGRRPRRRRRSPPCPGRRGCRPSRTARRRRASSACSRPRRRRTRRRSSRFAASFALISFWVALGNAHSAGMAHSGL